LSRFSGLRLQKRKKNRPEYPLVPRVAPDIRVYVPEKPVQRAASRLNTLQRSASTDEMERQAAVKTHSLLSEQIREEKRNPAQEEYAARTARRYNPRHAESDDMDKPGEAPFKTVERRPAINVGPGGHTPKHTLPGGPDESRMEKRSYVPRHAAPQDEGEAYAQRNGYIPRHAAPEDLQEDSKLSLAVYSDIPRRAKPEMPGTDEHLVREKAKVYGTGYSAEARHATPEPAPATAIPEGAAALRVVDESVYGEDIYGVAATYQSTGSVRKAGGARPPRPLEMSKLPQRNRSGNSGLMQDQTQKPTSARPPRRKTKIPRRPAAEKFTDSANPAGNRRRIMLLGAALVVTVAVLAALLIPGGWFRRDVPPMSTMTTTQPISQNSGEEHAAGVIPTPTATPEAGITATPQTAGTPQPTETPQSAVSPAATPASTATPAATPKSTPKPTSTPAATVSPTPTATAKPAATPTQAPTPTQTEAPTPLPTEAPTPASTEAPVSTPTDTAD
jgi:hypothetical protein